MCKRNMIATAVVSFIYFFADSNAVIRDYGMPIHINKIEFSPICKVKSILSKTIKFYRKMNLVCVYIGELNQAGILW